MFYKYDFNSQRFVKTIPSEELLLEFLTNRSLAYWFMDDGSRVSEKVKSMRLCTDSFKQEEVLINILYTKFNLKCSPIKDGLKYRIYISSKSYSDLIEILGPYIIPSMKYKLYF